MSSASGSTSAITLAAYLKRGGLPSFGDFDQAKLISQFGGTITFMQVEAGEWFILIYNDGSSLEEVNINVNVQGKGKNLMDCLVFVKSTPTN